MLGYQKAAAAAAWAAAEVLMLLGAAVHASPAGWPLDHFATGARYGEGDAGYGQSFSKGFGISFGHGLYGDGFDGNRLRNYGAGYGYGGNYGYGGSYKDWLEEWPGSFFERFPSRKNAAPAKFSKADSNFDFLGEPKYNIGWGSNDYLPGDKLSHNEFSDGEKVVGTYSLKEPGGHVRTVTYFADDSGGFQASVNSDGDFNGAAYGFEYGDGSAGLESALPQSWSGWAKGGGGGGGGGGGSSSWPGLWGAYGVAPLPAGYALQDTS